MLSVISVFVICAITLYQVTGVCACLLVVLLGHVVHVPLTRCVIHLPCWWSDKRAALCIQLATWKWLHVQKMSLLSGTPGSSKYTVFMAMFIALSGEWLIYEHNDSKLLQPRWRYKFNMKTVCVSMCVRVCVYHNQAANSGFEKWGQWGKCLKLAFFLMASRGQLHWLQKVRLYRS